MKAAREGDLKGLRAMPGLGKASAELLLDIGITRPAILRDIGAEEAWRRLRFAHGKRVTVTWIYALDIAIRGIAWKDLSEVRAARLRARAEAILAEIEPQERVGSRPTKRSSKSNKRV